MGDTVVNDNAAARRTAKGRGLNIALWVLQAALAVQFAGGGLLKITGATEMVDLFDDVGAGQWLRFAVGAAEVAGAIGLLIPMLSGLTALGLAVLMVGAAVTNQFVLDENPLLPVVLLVVAALIAWGRRSRTTELMGGFRR